MNVPDFNTNWLSQHGRRKLNGPSERHAEVLAEGPHQNDLSNRVEPKMPGPPVSRPRHASEREPAYEIIHPLDLSIRGNGNSRNMIASQEEYILITEDIFKCRAWHGTGSEPDVTYI